MGEKKEERIHMEAEKNFVVLPDCGKNFTGSSINSSFQVGNNSLCVWIITLPAPGEKGSVNIINMTLSAGSGSL